MIEENKLYCAFRWVDKDGKTKYSDVHFTKEFFDYAMLPLSKYESCLSEMAEAALESFLGEDHELLQKEPHAQAEEREGEL